MFYLSFLTRDIDGQGNALAVGIITLQGGVLALALTLLIHQT